MPYCIHRAPFSTHERMVAFLIEHFGGAFPTWLAPVQVQVLTVSEQYEAYGRSIVDRLRNQMVRAELATQSETVSKKIREGTTRKIPLLLIVGEREQADGTVTLRRYGQTQQHTMSIEDFEAALRRAIDQRTLDFASVSSYEPRREGVARPKDHCTAVSAFGCAMLATWRV